MSYMNPSPAWRKPKPVSDRYSAFIAVTRSPFSKRHYIRASANEPEEAERRCKQAANKEGWRPPVWWQWWRRKDSHEPYVAPIFSE